MSAALESFVRERAGHRCEYCRLHQDDAEGTPFHIEHIIAKQHGGGSGKENLCLACPHCNSHKGTNLTGLHQGRIYRLFNPRKQNWHRHFVWEHTLLVGKTGVGIVTVQILHINGAKRVELRENLLFEGRFPPEE